MNKNKTWGILVCGLILTMQIAQALLWRNDYPFTKWGMYHQLPSFEPYINVEIEISGNLGSESSLIKDPWILREHIWAQLDIGSPTSPWNQKIEFYLQRVEEKSRLNQNLIRAVILDSLWSPENLKNVTVTFLAWKKLDPTTRFNPDIKYIIFSGTP